MTFPDFVKKFGDAEARKLRKAAKDMEASNSTDKTVSVRGRKATNNENNPLAAAKCN
jgi:hypothetical protein